MTELPATWALVPVKGFERAKSRLSPLLGPARRAALARSLFEHVVGVVGEVTSLSGVAVVTDSPEVARLAARRRAVALFDAARGSMSAIIDAALASLAGRGAEAALVVMSDLPELERRDLERMLEALREAEMVLAPDLSGQGTNALGLRAPARWATAFGRHGSFYLHDARAREAGVRAAVVHSPGLAFDLDEATDLVRYARPPRRRTLDALM
jgi:2-phospho-L-lactate guanylyltransferase